MSKGGTIRRADRVGAQRTMFEKNRRRILMTQDYCAICGGLVDKTLPAGSDFSPEIDHIIPVSKNGLSDIDNLQLTHRICNRQKGNKLYKENVKAEPKTNPLAWSFDWANIGDE